MRQLFSCDVLRQFPRLYARAQPGRIEIVFSATLRLPAVRDHPHLKTVCILHATRLDSFALVTVVVQR